MFKMFNNLVDKLTANPAITVGAVFLMVFIVLILAMRSVFKSEKKRSK